MPAAFLILISLIGVTPVVLLFDGLAILGLWAAVLAVALIVVAGTFRSGEASHLNAIVRPLTIAAIIPALLILLQAAPLPFVVRPVNPIWGSAAAALGRPLIGSISIDTGSTLLSLYRYFAWLAIVLLASAVTIDRWCAEWTLFAATAAAVLIAALLIVNDVGGFVLLDQHHDAVGRGAALDAAALGVILSAACTVRAYERFETRRGNKGQDNFRLTANIGVCVVGFAICVTAIRLGHTNNTVFAAVAGLATLSGFVAVRRLGLGQAGSLAVGVVGCLLAVQIITANSAGSNLDFTIRFAGQSSPNAITQRMLADASWSGTGAGTYYDLIPIYLDPHDVAGNLSPPSAAAEIAIELGRPLLWVAALAVCVVSAALLRAAMRRGRDSFYPAAGAASLIALLILAFGNAGLLASAILIITGVVLGLAVAQSRSRTVQ